MINSKDCAQEMIKIKNLKKSYGKLEVLKGINTEKEK